METLQQVIHSLSVFLHFIDEEGEFRDNPCLVADPVAQGLADFLLMMVQVGQYCFFVGSQHHADVDPGKAEVGAHAHVNDGDKDVTQRISLIALEDITEFFLNQPGKFLLSNGATHGVKIGKGGG